MPYLNQINKDLANKHRETLTKYINHTPFIYDFFNGMGQSQVGNSSKELITDENMDEKREELMNKMNLENIKNENLVSRGGFAGATTRDIGYPSEMTTGAGKRKRTVKKTSKKSESNKSGYSNLELTRKGGKRKKKITKKSVEDLKQFIGKLEKKLEGGNDLAKPYNMVKKDGTTGGSKMMRAVGGHKLQDKAVLHGSSFSGMGKKTKKANRHEIVKKVMKDRKVSMIEASKIVKEEGLY